MKYFNEEVYQAILNGRRYPDNEKDYSLGIVDRIPLEVIARINRLKDVSNFGEEEGDKELENQLLKIVTYSRRGHKITDIQDHFPCLNTVAYLYENRRDLFKTHDELLKVGEGNLKRAFDTICGDNEHPSHEIIDAFFKGNYRAHIPGNLLSRDDSTTKVRNALLKEVRNPHKALSEEIVKAEALEEKVYRSQSDASTAASEEAARTESNASSVEKELLDQAREAAIGLFSREMDEVLYRVPSEGRVGTINSQKSNLDIPDERKVGTINSLKFPGKASGQRGI